MFIVTFIRQSLLDLTLEQKVKEKIRTQGLWAPEHNIGLCIGTELFWEKSLKSH